MNSDDLSAYLNDHLAGAAGALELVEHLLKTHGGKPLEQFFRQLHDDIKADEATLREFMQMCDVKESVTRKAGAWLAEKFGCAKFSVGGKESGEFGLLQALEALVLGITGKQLLWRAMMESAALREKMDFAALEKRAQEQRDRLESKRLQTAQQVFRLE